MVSLVPHQCHRQLPQASHFRTDRPLCFPLKCYPRPLQMPLKRQRVSCSSACGLLSPQPAVEMAHSVKCSHTSMRKVPDNCVKSRAWWHAPVTPELGKQRQDPGACWPVNSVKEVSSRLSRREKQRQIPTVSRSKEPGSRKAL